MNTFPELTYEHGNKMLAAMIRHSLESQYGFCLLSGLPIDTQDSALEHLAKQMGTPSLAGAHAVDGRAVYDIKGSKSGKLDEHGLLIYSSRYDEFPAHTDEYRIQSQVDLVFLHCIQPNPEGQGLSLICPLKSLLENLTANDLSLMLRPIWPTQFGLAALLTIEDRRTTIRFNSLEIQRFAEIQKIELTNNQGELLQRLGTFLREKTPYRLLLRTGDCLIMNNRSVLHGRTVFPDASSRLFKRVRLHAQPPLKGHLAAAIGVHV